MKEQYDHIVIGTGQAGPSLAAALSADGQKVVVIERGRFGGTCVNRGCIPPFLLVRMGDRRVSSARRAGGGKNRVPGFENPGNDRAPSGRIGGRTGVSGGRGPQSGPYTSADVHRGFGLTPALSRGEREKISVAGR